MRQPMRASRILRTAMTTPRARRPSVIAVRGIDRAARIEAFRVSGDYSADLLLAAPEDRHDERATSETQHNNSPEPTAHGCRSQFGCSLVRCGSSQSFTE